MENKIEITEGLVWYSKEGMRYEVISVGKSASVVQFGYTNYDWQQRVITHTFFAQALELGIWTINTTK